MLDLMSLCVVLVVLCYGAQWNLWGSSLVVAAVFMAASGALWLDKLLLMSFRFTTRSFLFAHEQAYYVHRPDLELEINAWMKSAPDGYTMVLYGPRGCGKSSTVGYLARQRQGVVLLNVRETTTRLDVMKAIANSSTLRAIEIPAFLAAMERCSKLLTVWNITPVVVFEVERARSELSDSVVPSVVASMSKELARVCKVMVVVSDANAAVGFNTDYDRIIYRYVGELTEGQAFQMWSKRGTCPKTSKENLQRVFATLGTKPSMLNHMHTQLKEGWVRALIGAAVQTSHFTCRLLQVQDVDTYIAARLRRAKNALTGFKHRKLILALKHSPEGVPVEDLEGVYDEGVHLHDPVQVAPAMEWSDCVLFCAEKCEYQLQSRMFVTALAALTFKE